MMPVPKRLTPTWERSGSLSTWDVLNLHEFDIRDWHALVKVSAEAMLYHLGKGRPHWAYANEAVMAEADFLTLLTRAQANALMDPLQLRLRIADTTTMYEMMAIESLGVGAVLGVALARTWPTDPATFDGWLERAIAYAGLTVPDHIPTLIGEEEIAS